MTAAEMVLADGDRVHGWGRFVVDDDGQWLDLSRVIPLGLPDGPRHRNRRYSVRVIGAVDTAAVPTTFGPPGVTPGAVTLTGVWDGSALHVERQSPVRHPDFDEERSTWTVPPCPAPAGGWPAGMNGDEPDNLTFDLGDLQSTGAAVTVVVFRPAPGRAVLVVAATDIDRVREVLAAQLPGRLCVVPSRWTRAQLAAVRTTLFANMQAWSVQLLGEHVDDRAQPSVSANPLCVRTELADWADALPRGLLTLHPALLPARDTAS